MGLLANLLLCTLCHAQGPQQAGLAAEDAGGDSDYRQIIQEAVAEFQRANWNEAIVLFRRAHRLRPSPKTHRGLGQAYFEARDYVNAIPHLRAALRSPQSFTAEQQSSLGHFLERSLAFVGTVKLQLSPKHATLLLDGVEVEETAENEPLWLNPGSHTLLASADGYKPLQQQISVEGGTERALRIDLVPEHTNVATVPVSGSGGLSNDPQAPSAQTQRLRHASHSSDGKSALQTAAWVTAGIAAASGVASLVLWRVREDGPVADWYGEGCNSPERMNDEGCLKKFEEADSLELGVYVSGGASAVMAATAITLLVFSYLGDDDPQDETALRCLPGIGNLQCGMRF